VKRAEQPEPVDSELIALLAGRDGQRTTIELRDGRQVFVFNIAWGSDMGDEYTHVTTNVSPSIQGERIDFFFTNEVDAVKDEAEGSFAHVR